MFVKGFHYVNSQYWEVLLVKEMINSIIMRVMQTFKISCYGFETSGRIDLDFCTGITEVRHQSINISKGMNIAVSIVVPAFGQLYHWLGSLRPAKGEPPRFLQLYIYDTDNEVDNRMHHFGGDNSGLRDSEGSDYGGRLILPQSFTCWPCYMYAHYLDALAICRVHGNPSFFITFTCNIKWPKITEYMEDFLRLTTTNRADIVDRVFEMKIHQFVKYLRDAEPFGKIIASNSFSHFLYTVEFQKRGLPHCQTLIWIDERSRVQKDRDIDAYIFVELSSKYVDPVCHRVVSELMMHGTCGLVCPTAPCTYPIVARVSRSNETTSSSTRQPQMIVDEMKNYLDVRYLSPHEA
ncbi:DNA helicase [Tanacetum coccineum]|uniref:DNA helicase n=1 Tax=Tanacetum coccineum TaxID=301880 RepID=A0ABQ4ZNF3_9ASTR